MDRGRGSARRGIGPGGLLVLGAALDGMLTGEMRVRQSARTVATLPTFDAGSRSSKPGIRRPTGEQFGAQ